jgi:dihydroflavonol-4-reductase
MPWSGSATTRSFISDITGPGEGRFESMKILITGATGFLGAVLMPRLIRRFGAESLTAFVLPEDKVPLSWAGQDVRIRWGDIADSAAVADAVQGHAQVIHMAGLISYWKRDLARLMKVNRDGARCIVEACLRHGVNRLIHVSSVGAIGFHKSGEPSAEDTPFNWPSNIYYMVSKHEGQRIVEEAVREHGLPAVIINPASIMGPGDHNLATPHNQLYRTICRKRPLGSFSGGLAVVDVRDLADIILKALDQGRIGEKYLAVGANVSYPEMIRMISRSCGRKSYPFRIPAPLIAAAGGLLELVSAFTKKRPLLTFAYGRLSGWRAYYSNEKSRREFSHSYIPIERTVADGWTYFAETFGPGE